MGIELARTYRFGKISKGLSLYKFFDQYIGVSDITKSGLNTTEFFDDCCVIRL